VEVPANGRVAVPWSLSVTDKGIYRANFTWTANGQEHEYFTRLALIKPYAHDDSVFGINHPATTVEQHHLLSKGGLRWVRQWSVNWEWVEPVEGNVSWAIPDEQIQFLEDSGMKTLVVFPNPSTNWASE